MDTVTLFFVVLFSMFLFFFHHPLLDSVFCLLLLCPLPLLRLSLYTNIENLQAFFESRPVTWVSGADDEIFMWTRCVRICVSYAFTVAYCLCGSMRFANTCLGVPRVSQLVLSTIFTYCEVVSVCFSLFSFLCFCFSLGLHVCFFSCERSLPITQNKCRCPCEWPLMWVTLIRTSQNRSEPIRTFLFCFGLLRLATLNSAVLSMW